VESPWLKRWKVPGSNGGEWTVAIDKDGNWGCSCPVWKFQRLPFAERKQCHHILQVKMDGGEEIKGNNKPRYVLANVNKPKFKKETNELLIPLIKIPDLKLMEATVCCYMLKHGYSWGEIKEIRRIPPGWTMRAVLDHVERHGEACY